MKKERNKSLINTACTAFVAVLVLLLSAQAFAKSNPLTKIRRQNRLKMTIAFNTTDSLKKYGSKKTFAFVNYLLDESNYEENSKRCPFITEYTATIKNGRRYWVIEFCKTCSVFRIKHKGGNPRKDIYGNYDRLKDEIDAFFPGEENGEEITPVPTNDKILTTILNENDGKIYRLKPGRNKAIPNFIGFEILDSKKLPVAEMVELTNYMRQDELYREMGKSFASAFYLPSYAMNGGDDKILLISLAQRKIKIYHKNRMVKSLQLNSDSNYFKMLEKFLANNI